MPILQPDQIYQLLRNLTSPVVAITSERGGKRNGMIADSAVRASIVPAIPRVSVYVHKFNYSHDLIFETGEYVLHRLRDDQFELIHRLGFTSGRARDKLAGVPHRCHYVLHLLRDDQFELIHRLGFTSGRARDKLAGVPHRTGTLGVPVLDDCYAHFECRVANVMDTGSSTCFLGDVVAVGHGAADRPSGTVMTAAHFRANMPAEWRGEYEALLRAAQQFAAERSHDIRPVVWTSLRQA